MNGMDTRAYFDRKALRDKFATAAMTGMLSDPDCSLTPAAGAELAYQWADAMMAERDKRCGNT